MNKNINERINQILTELQIPYRYKGREYLHTAILIYLEDPHSINDLKYGLYQKIRNFFGQEKDLTPYQIDSSVRYAILTMSKNVPSEIFSKYFRGAIRKVPPTEFIESIGLKIKQEEG